jgi:hypothetical protein
MVMYGKYLVSNAGENEVEVREHDVLLILGVLLIRHLNSRAWGGMWRVEGRRDRHALVKVPHDAKRTVPMRLITGASTDQTNPTVCAVAPPTRKSVNRVRSANRALDFSSSVASPDSCLARAAHFFAAGSMALWDSLVMEMGPHFSMGTYNSCTVMWGGCRCGGRGAG